MQGCLGSGQSLQDVWTYKTQSLTAPRSAVSPHLLLAPHQFWWEAPSASGSQNRVQQEKCSRQIPRAQTGAGSSVCCGGGGGARRGKQGRGHPPSGLGFKGHPRQHSNQPMVLTSLWTWWLLLWAQTVLQSLHWLGVWLCGREFVLGVLRVHVLLLLRRVTGRKLLASSKHALFTRASQHLAQEPGTHCTRAGPAKRPAKLRLRTTHRWGAWQQPDLTARARAPAPTPPPPPENRLGNRQALRAAGNPSPSLLPRLLSGLNLLGANAEQLPQVAV